MSDQVSFLRASSFTLDAFADIVTRSFEAYAYDISMTAALISWRACVDSIDLYHSLVMLVGDEPAGMAVLGLRRERAWCGGFGVMVPFRGRGLSHQLTAALLDQARQAGAREFSLEVLTRNHPAITTYARAGFEVRRDLLILEWHREPDTTIPQPDSTIIAVPCDQLLEHFAALHPLPAAWQRDLPGLLVRGPMDGLAILEHYVPVAYVLFRTVENGMTHVMDVGARDSAHIAPLLHAVQARNEQISVVNEPAESPFIPAFLAAGFTEADRQHEMVIALPPLAAED